MLLLTPAIASINARNPYHLDDNAKVLYCAKPLMSWRRFFSADLIFRFFAVLQNAEQYPSLRFMRV